MKPSDTFQHPNDDGDLDGGRLGGGYAEAISAAHVRATLPLMK